MILNDIRKKMREKELDAYVISYGNRFIGQDVLPSEHKLKAICGFSGSAGILAITADEAYLLVDGRYELQARKETDEKLITVVDKMPRFKNVCDLLSEKGLHNIGYDAWCHSVAEMEFLKRKCRDIQFEDVGDWLNLDNKSTVKVLMRDTKFAGLSREEKCKKVADFLWENQSDYYLFTSADSVSWLLNVYAKDLLYSPVVRAYALVSLKGKVILFADNLETSFDVRPVDDLKKVLSKLGEAKILYDAHITPEKIRLLAGEQIVLNKMPDICQSLKVVKNATELQGMIDCHIRDGAALVSFLAWLDDNWQGLTELDTVRKLHEFRARQQNFFSESFATIAASGENSAIVHYQPTEASNQKLQKNSLFLLDSGGQYLDGTTDVTRTIVFGEPTKDMITDFTTVLKAHIALAKARFPEGTAGIKLDVLPRSCLWQRSLDYKHGTGHGVACFGNVHEGPISISAGSSDYGFQANMVCSNEPGVYNSGKYGIRIENLQYTVLAGAASDVNFLEFKYLTKVPIDKRLIDKYLLTDEEQAWVNSYHKSVYDTLAPYVGNDVKLWLERACSSL